MIAALKQLAVLPVLMLLASVASREPADIGRQSSQNGAAVDTARLTPVLDSIRRAIGATGASAAVATARGTVWIGSSGEAWAGEPVHPSTAFDIGSIAKPFTAALILRLVADGHLMLDDSVSRWRPDFPAPGVTIRHLLAQTSGIPDYAANTAFLPTIRSRMAGPWPPAENLRLVGPERVKPDSVWAYSNTNYVLLGLIAADAGGQSYSALLNRHVLDPLRLKATFVAGEDSITAPRAHAFVDFTGDGKPDDLSALVPDPATTRGAGGAGAIVATAHDVARFAQAYFTGSLVGESLHREATRWRDRGAGLWYGFGIIAKPLQGDTLLGHMGNAAGLSAGVWHSTARGVTAVILTNVHGVAMSTAVQRLLDEAHRPGR